MQRVYQENEQGKVSKRIITPSSYSCIFHSPQCLLGLNCYVDTIYLTMLATFLAILLRIWAGYREDRMKIEIMQDTGGRSEVIQLNEEALTGQ